MLIAVVLKIIPTEFTLEYNRRNVDKKLSPDINDFLEFFQAEIESRERTYLMEPEFDTTSLYTNSKKNKFKPLNKVQGRTSTCEFVTSDSLPLEKKSYQFFLSGIKTPIEKDYDVVKLTLKNKDSPNLKIDIDALVTDQISAANIPPPELDNILQTVHLENLVLADSPDCKEPITILIGSDYDVVTGKIKHLSKKLRLKPSSAGVFKVETAKIKHCLL
ncbi:uncharacterized protein TNCT_126151 [Trichonephila clavata]|uniref:Uncharacterized protein n=1 Tax=Trichonephila clavata TaxID=2740835 RepID=A0A8X6L9Y2_TRICU|nr:uncharacterized protein TNCT_126151 [Trichonephila clavata]